MQEPLDKKQPVEVITDEDVSNVLTMEGVMAISPELFQMRKEALASDLQAGRINRDFLNEVADVASGMSFLD